MQIACSSWSLRRDINESLPLLAFPAWCGSQGITALEIPEQHFPTMEREYLDALSRACASSNTRIACLSVSTDFTTADADRQFSQAEHLRFLMQDVAKPLKVPVLRVTIGTEDTSTAGDQRALEALRGLVVAMEETGVSLALDQDGRTQTPPEKIAAIIAGVESRAMGSCADLAALPADRRDDALHALVPLAKLVHARSYAFDAQGDETSVDYQRGLALLAEYGYDDVIAIVYGGKGDPYEGVLKTMALIEKYWYQQPGQARAA